VSAGSFFQSRSDGAVLLSDLVAAEVPEGTERLVDAYAGVGLFAATVAPGAEVIVLEQSPAAVSDARCNLVDRAATIVRGDVARWRPAPAEVVIADPARAGLGAKAASVLAGTGADRFVLVSCDAAALARDASLLAGFGYRHRRTTVVDLFPHTPHVECVSVFDLGDPPPPPASY
jgi:23S rRNA (uracil1939-C5)-methyltransferase